MKDIKISAMWMTRKRSHELIYSVCSFLHKADDNSNIEYIFITDPDDSETVEALEKLAPMAHAHDAEFIHIEAPERYGYGSLEKYQNKVAEHFTGECIISFADDNICIQQGWDTALREELIKRQGTPAWLSITPLNEIWKGYPTIVGINRAWYEKTKRFSGTRATDIYISDLGKAANIEPITPHVDTLHLQRGRTTSEYQINGQVRRIFCLPAEDDFGGANGKNKIHPAVYHKDHKGMELPEHQVTDYKLGKQIFFEDLQNLIDT